jgi:hypothetical protein
MAVTTTNRQFLKLSSYEIKILEEKEDRAGRIIKP